MPKNSEEWHSHRKPLEAVDKQEERRRIALAISAMPDDLGLEQLIALVANPNWLTQIDGGLLSSFADVVKTLSSAAKKELHSTLIALQTYLPATSGMNQGTVGQVRRMSVRELILLRNIAPRRAQFIKELFPN
jgi:hypothetical protein